VVQKSDKNEQLIPTGGHCYEWIERPSAENNFVGKTKPCPFYGEMVFNNVNVPWCHFLDKGGLDERDYGEDWGKLVQHFGSEEEVLEALPLGLLWDGVKECGVSLGSDNSGGASR